MGFLPEYRVSKLLLDSAHDSLATYLFCREQGITFSAVDSRPICMDSEKMVRDGTERKRMRIKYYCPYAWRSSIHRCPHCDEYCNKQFKNNWRLKSGHHHSSKCWHCRLYLTAMCIRLNAWDNAS